MAEWFYMRDGQRNGPVSLEQLRSLAWSGQIGPQDLLWTDSMAKWAAAGEAAELAGAFPAAPPAQVLAYAGPSSEVMVLSERALQMLVQTKPWVRFIGIMFYVIAGLVALGSVAMLVLGRMGGRPEFFGIMAVYFIGGIIYAALGVYLNRYASHIDGVMRLRRTLELESALEAQKTFWRLAGIILLVLLIIYAAALLIGGLVAAMR